MSSELTPKAIDFLQDLAALLERHDAGLWTSDYEGDGFWVGGESFEMPIPGAAADVWRHLSEAYAPTAPPRPRPTTPLQAAARASLSVWARAAMEDSNRTMPLADFMRGKL